MPYSNTPIPRTLQVITTGMSEGLHSGVQLYASIDGVPAIDEGFGEMRPGVAMTRDGLLHWLSCSKPVAAVAIARLWEQERIGLDDPVSRYIPEFGQRGKEAITLRHLLTHTASIRVTDIGTHETPWAETIRRICAMPVERNWTPGKKAGYHLSTSWFILGELIRRLDGRPFDRYVREDIFEPLGMVDCWVGMPAEAYHFRSERIAWMYNTAQQPATSVESHTPERCAGVAPGSNGRGPMRELGRFYEMLLGHGQRDGVRILSAPTVSALTAGQRIGMLDQTFQHILDWGLGFIINSNRYGVETVPYGFGRHSSPRTFGHGGYQSSAAFADPERRLAVAIAFNGMPGEQTHNRRIRDTLTSLYEDLGLTDSETG